MPTINVDLLDTKVTREQKKQLAQSLTKVIFETLGYSEAGITVVFRSTSKNNIARAGKLGG